MNDELMNFNCNDPMLFICAFNCICILFSHSVALYVCVRVRVCVYLYGMSVAINRTTLYSIVIFHWNSQWHMLNNLVMQFCKCDHGNGMMMICIPVPLPLNHCMCAPFFPDDEMARVNSTGITLCVHQKCSKLFGMTWKLFRPRTNTSSLSLALTTGLCP